MTELEQLEADLDQMEKDADAYRRAERWTDLAALELRIRQDSNRLAELEMQAEVSAWSRNLPPAPSAPTAKS